MLYQHVQRPLWRRHPVMAGAAAVVAVWWLAYGWYEPLAVAAVLTALWALSRRRRAATVRDAGIRARADYEHRLSLAGDPRGTYGRYPPVQAGWYPDPRNGCLLRYFDGATWTSHAVWR
ncbi:DUF2510 domain-containing protein [Mycobacterium sp. Y57]|uniref:DUF2510 domain-containing protein n=1 Tax=Mycolicibacterium xanthum TaxID=2796469 RepID=UPI001C84AB90|nr:DUF2510 domain-containing protein [Mycolicibacterium xanthum]MBX7432344.1 DUF2510 domain-containing protein [Mycolicibacterium xanthum]